MPRDDDDEPPTLRAKTPEEFAAIILRTIVEQEAKLERQAAETGKPADAEFVLAQDVITRRVLLRIRIHCDPGRPATHSIEYVDDVQG